MTTWEHWTPFLLTAIPGLFAFISSLINRQRLQKIHVTLNGKLDEFISAIKVAAYAEGMKDEKFRAGEVSKAHSDGIIEGITEIQDKKKN